MEQKEITVWTNGNAVRKYTGQDKTIYGNKKGWYKARAIIIPVKEDE